MKEKLQSLKSDLMRRGWTEKEIARMSEKRLKAIYDLFHYAYQEYGFLSISKMGLKAYLMSLNYNLSKVKDRKTFAMWLKKNGLIDYWTIQHTIDDALEYNPQYSKYKTIDSYRLANSENEFVEKFGEVGKNFVDVCDKCLELGMDRNYFDNAFKSDHNTYGRQMGVYDYPTLYEFSVNGETYDDSIQFENYRTYKEKFIRISELGGNAIAILTNLLYSKIEEELAYREKMKFEGELSLEYYAEQLQKVFDNREIKVCEGKRQCDGNCKPYKAIVVSSQGDYVGSITMNVNHRGILKITRRVPLCGECSYECEPSKILESLIDDIKSMWS